MFSRSFYSDSKAFLGLSGNEPSCQYKRCSLIPGLGSSLEKEMATSPVFLPEKSHEQRSLAGYSPWDHKNFRHNLAINQQ